MTRLRNGFELPSGDAQAITNANGADPDGWDNVSATAAQILETDTAIFKYGVQSGRFGTGVTVGQSYVAWTKMAGETTFYGRMYVYITSTLSVFQAFLRPYKTGNLSCFSLGFDASRHVQLLNSAGTLIKTWTAIVPTATWIRVEFRFEMTTSGSWEVHYYANPNGLTPTESWTDLTVSTGNFRGTADEYRIGTPSSAANLVPIQIDGIELNNYKLPGPYGYFPRIVAENSLADSANGTTHDVPLPVPANGIKRNDIVMIFAGIDGTSAIAPPDGTWNEIVDESVGTTPSARAGVYWKRMSGGETGNVQFTTASEGGGWISKCIRNVDKNTAPEITSVTNGGASANIADPASLDPSGWATEHTLWLAMMVVDGNNAVTVAPTGFSNLLNIRWANVNGAGVATAELERDASSVNPGVFTHGAGQNGAYTIALRPARPFSLVAKSITRKFPLLRR